MKKCANCKIDRDFSCFSKRSVSKDGLKPTCKQCDAAYMLARRVADPDGERARSKAYRDSNPEKVKAAKKDERARNSNKYKERNRVKYLENKDTIIAKVRAYAAKNPDKIKAGSRAYYEKNKQEILAKTTAYIKANPDVKKRSQRNYGAKNKDAILAKSKVYRDANPEKRLEWARAWRADNQPLANAYNVRRRAARKSLHRPCDADLLALVEIEAFDLCARREIVTGEKWEVDHAVPLQGRTVSGLHNEFNLAVIPRRVNRSKSNRIWPNMP